MKSNSKIDVQIDRELVRRGGMAAFVRLAWELVEPSAPLVWNWHIDLICVHLMAVMRGEIRDLGINIPPGCMKSSLVSVFFPAYQAIEHGGADAMIHASFDDSLSLRDSNKCKGLIETDWFQARWGDKCRVSKSSTHANSATEWNLIGEPGGGWRFSTSVGGKATGRHADVLVVDDPTKPKDIDGKALATTKTWAQETIASRRKNPATFRRILIMQRLHEDDLAGFYLTQPGWVWLVLPMEYDEDRPCVTKWGRDPRTVDGELLWPARYSAEEVAKLKGPNGVGATAYASQYQQEPNPKTGGIFKREWFTQRWRVLPVGLTLLQSWDMRFKEESDSGDFVACGIWGQVGSQYYLLDRLNERLSFTGTVAAMLDMTKKWPKAFLKLVENKANGPAVYSALKKRVPGIVLVEPDGGKIARANAATAPLEAMNVWFPADAPWMEDYVRQHALFPRAKHDDEVDQTTQALTRMMTRTNAGYLEGLKRLAQNGDLVQD